MLATFGLVAWVVPMFTAFPPQGRAYVDLGEYTSAFGASRWFGWEFEDSAARVFRIVLMILGVLVAVPEILGL
jgi:hypothetical protein